MSDEPRQEMVKVPVLAVVLPHPTENRLMIQLNEQTPIEERVDFCLACAQTFIGLAGELIEKQKSPILKPELGIRGPLR